MEIPKGHYIFGTVKVGERGQIVIPREARDKFNIKAGDTLLVLVRKVNAVTNRRVTEIASDIFRWRRQR
ncbi:MAG: AbrB/MazE/SpoVT family DNA-binding domain-containing protein [Christensenellaceae bacterium]